MIFLGSFKYYNIKWGSYLFWISTDHHVQPDVDQFPEKKRNKYDYYHEMASSFIFFNATNYFIITDNAHKVQRGSLTSFPFIFHCCLYELVMRDSSHKLCTRHELCLNNYSRLWRVSSYDKTHLGKGLLIKKTCNSIKLR